MDGVMICWNCKHKNDVDEVDYFRPRREGGKNPVSPKITIKIPC